MRNAFLIAACIVLTLAGCSESIQPKPQRHKAEPRAAEVAPELAESVAVAASAAVDNADIAVGEIARGYKALRRMTPEGGVGVNWELSALCRGVMEVDVKAAQKRNGVHAYCGISIYMNPLAAAAFQGHKSPYPPGSVIIKEKVFGAYQKSMSSQEMVRPKDGVGGMIKRAPGYDPDQGDWEYFYFEDPSKIEAGKISSCVTCHAGAAGTDHVFGSWDFGQKRRRY